jgi:hypothetical protein
MSEVRFVQGDIKFVKKALDHVFGANSTGRIVPMNFMRNGMGFEKAALLMALLRKSNLIKRDETKVGSLDKIMVSRKQIEEKLTQYINNGIKQKAEKMNLYLDIDGVLLLDDNADYLLKDRTTAANYIDEFVKALIESDANLYWLTFWCSGGVFDVRSALENSDMKPATIELLLEHVELNNWEDSKIEGIDFARPFIWFDDGSKLNSDWKSELDKRGVADSLVVIDLQSNPDQLLECIDLIYTSEEENAQHLP